MTYKASSRRLGRRTTEGRDSDPRRPPAHGLPRYLHKASPGTLPESKTSARLSLPLGRPDTLLEREADAMASRIGGASAPAMAPNGAVPKDTAHPMRPSGAAAPPRPSPLPGVIGSAGSPLPEAARATLEAGFNTSFGDVRVHTGPDAARLARGLGARAFTHGSDIFFGAGESAGANALTAHELTHVLQQSGGRPGEQAAGPVSGTGGENPVQCSFTGSYLIPGSTNGVFEIDLQTREGAVATPATKSGLDGYIRFVPAPGAPNSNVIAMTQIVRLTDAGGTDVNPSSMPAAQAPRGALGDSGLRTEDDPLRGIEGGFFTDVHHRPNAASPGVPQGTFLSPRYNFQPAAPGTTGVAGQTPQPGVYGGGIGGVVGQTPGFKRSDDPADIRSAAMYDFPGTASATANLDFTFETAALGEDTMLTYGAVNWGFGLRAGRVVNEHLAVEAGTSATFGEALERHRDFYVHEPVAFYFDFDSAALSPAEAAKIDAFLAYLTRNPDVELSIDGYADEVGGASDYNAGLSLRRAAAVEAALLAKGIAAARINGLMIGHGASTAATTNAGTGDQGGNAALGADQSREANRWANRRAVVSFSHVPAAGP